MSITWYVVADTKVKYGKMTVSSVDINIRYTRKAKAYLHLGSHFPYEL